MLAIALALLLLQATTGPQDSAPPPIDDCASISRGDPRLEPASQACRAARTIHRSLPNFLCDQVTTRTYALPVRKQVGHTVELSFAKTTDVITAEVRYIDGEERFDNVKLNGRLTDLNFPLRGMWSEGDFSPPGLAIVGSRTTPDFHYSGERPVGGLRTSIIDYNVPKERNQSWMWKLENDLYLPAFRGSLWIDMQSGELRHVSMQAMDIDDWVPWSKVDMATDYRDVVIEGLGTYLLPVRSEITSCARKRDEKSRPVYRQPAADPAPIPTGCMTNVIEFHSCRRFAGKARIVP